MNRPIVLLALALVGCGHSEPFGSGKRPDAGGPFTATPPVRLTFNIGADWTAAWSPDGSQIFYSAQDSSRLDRDRCLVRLPAGGGTLTEILCPYPGENDLTEIFQQPTLDGGGMAYAISVLGVSEHSQFRFSLWRADARPHAPATLLQTFPYSAPSGKSHDAPLNLQWLRPNVLLYLGAENGCCNKDTLRFGDQVALLDLTGPSPVRSFVPGTFRASSVAAGRDGASIYYTFYGDSRVWHQELTGGVASLVHDFGAGHVVRDPQVAGQRLVAVVDGQPGYRDVPPFGLVQIDHGGLLVTVDLTSGTETPLPASPGVFYRRPVLSPAGDRMVVEGYPYSVTEFLDGDGNVLFADTAVTKWADLWLLEE